MYCFKCQEEYSAPHALTCDSCGSSLLIKGHRAVKILNPDTFSASPVLEVIDGDGLSKVMRLVRGAERIRLMEDVVMGQTIVSRQSDRSFCPRIEDGFSLTFAASEEPIYCVLLEKVDGPTLHDYVETHSVSDELIVNWLAQLFEMIDAFHGQSWFLRDIKPDNLVVNPDGQLIFVDIDSFFHWSWAESSPYMHLSSPGYTAPEQSDGKPGATSDVFSIGRTAIFCLTGRSPVDLHGDDGFTWRHLLKKSSPLLLDFIERLVALSPIDRPTVKDSIKYLKSLPTRIRKESRWNQYKWPVTIALSLLALGVCIPLEKRFSSWTKRVSGDEQQLVGNVEQANALYGRSLRANAKNASAYLGLGMTCTEEGCGIEYLEKAMALEPDNDLIAYNLAVLYETADSVDSQLPYQQALDLYEGITSESSLYVLSQNNIARLEILRGNTETAIALLDQLKEQSGDGIISDKVLAKVYKNHGLAYMQSGDYQTAQVSLNKAVSLNPLLGDSYCLLASIDPQQLNLVNCFLLDSQSPESSEIKAKFVSKYLNNPK